MKTLPQLFARNRAWARRVSEADPDFFLSLARQQRPQYLWIGCADSRVPANEIVDLKPGELFVHRNVANLVIHTDLNCLSVLQFGVDVLKVRHVIVCGHYGCSGVEAALRKRRLGLIDNWLRHVQDVEQKHRESLAVMADDETRVDRLCELNVIEQAVSVCETTIVQDAWLGGQALDVHGWVYSLKDGILRDLDVCISEPGGVEPVYRAAVRRATAGEPR